MTDDWQAHELDPSEPGWVQMTETGWDALKLWCAGPDNRARAPRDDRDRTVRVVCETGGTVTQTIEPFTADDLRIMEEAIDSYLAEGGVPPLPRGYRWYLRIPDGLSGDLLDHLESHLNSRLTGAPKPADWLRELQPIMDDIYRTEPAADASAP